MSSVLGSLGTFGDKRLEKGGRIFWAVSRKLAPVVLRDWVVIGLVRCGLRAFYGTQK